MPCADLQKGLQKGSSPPISPTRTRHFDSQTDRGTGNSKLLSLLFLIPFQTSEPPIMQQCSPGSCIMDRLESYQITEDFSCIIVSL